MLGEGAERRNQRLYSIRARGDRVLSCCSLPSSRRPRTSAGSSALCNALNIASADAVPSTRGNPGGAGRPRRPPHPERLDWTVCNTPPDHIRFCVLVLKGDEEGLVIRHISQLVVHRDHGCGKSTAGAPLPANKVSRPGTPAACEEWHTQRCPPAYARDECASTRQPPLRPVPMVI
jgi:hypothetical protein